MIEVKDVIRMRVPFPDIEAELAVVPHMYVCMEKSESKKSFIKCQTLKPKHLGRNKAPFRRVREKPDVTRNPFKQETLIDCDKLFIAESTTISTDLLTTIRRDVCENLYHQIGEVSEHDSLERHELDTAVLSSINHKIRSAI